MASFQVGELYFHVEAIMDLSCVGLFEGDSWPVEGCIISSFDPIRKLRLKKQIVEIDDELRILIC